MVKVFAVAVAATAAVSAESAFGVPQEVRGFGRVEVFAPKVVESAPGVTVRVFKAESSEKASAIAGKFIDDLMQWEGVEVSPSRVMSTRGGQGVLVSLQGARCLIYTAGSASDLETFAKSDPDAVAGATLSTGHPAFLNRFGWGLYGIGGMENMHDWMNVRTPDDPGVKDPREDMEWVRSLGIHFELWPKNSGMDAADGLPDANADRWERKWADEHGMVYGQRLYINAGGSDWTDRFLGDYKDRNAPFLLRAWLRNWEYLQHNNAHFTWYDRDIQRFLGRQTQQLMEARQGDNTISWMQPHGELMHGDAWYDMHADYSPAAGRSWRAYLRSRGVTLDEASRMYRRGDSPFLDWDQVPVPEFATFAGLPGMIQDLSGDWAWKCDLRNAPAPDSKVEADDPAGGGRREVAWADLPWEQRYPGIRERWFAKSLEDMSGWGVVNMPGNEKMYTEIAGMRSEAVNGLSLWFRRAFEYSPSAAGGRKVFLYFFPMGQSRTFNKPDIRYHEIYINGEKAGDCGNWCALDVTDRLVAGDNQITLHLFDGRWDGRIFLSVEEPAVYPNLGADRNRLFTIWNDWRMDSKRDGWEIVFDAMRQVDPEKPIKCMAPQGFGADRWISFCRRYGAWPHFTGEGMWFYPWYKRYAKVYGIPATSELAGPAATIQQNFDGFRRTFLAGLDGHEPVFLAQTYSRDPETRAWWESHNIVFKRMGKYDIAGPQVMIYRHDGGMGSEGIAPYPPIGVEPRIAQSCWDWDIGRGTLQTIGQSYLYIDNGGVLDGRIADYPVTMDCGNEIIDEQIVAALRHYVEAGGTFIAYPFTGRSSPASPDSWPISALSGLSYAQRGLGGEIVFEQDETLLPGYAGKRFADRGSSVNCVFEELCQYSVELGVPDGSDGHEVVARYENGSPAIVVSRVGNGRVVSLGSFFWRDASDINGLWPAGARECEFIAALLHGLGFPDAQCVSGDPRIWMQPYRSNSGFDFVAVAVNWHEEGVQDTSVALRLRRRPSRLVSYGVDGVKSLAFEWDETDGTARFDLEMPAKEVKLVCAEVFDAGDSVDYWWERLAAVWHGLAPASDFDYRQYERGKWAVPAMDISDGARFTCIPPEGDAWLGDGFDASEWTEAPIDFLNVWGAKDGAPLWLRKEFDIPRERIHNGQIRLISGSWSGPRYMNATRMILNGTELHGFVSDGFFDIDVTDIVREGRNVLCFEAKGGKKEVGFAGFTCLHFREVPLKSFDLSGKWAGKTLGGEPLEVTIPGDFNSLAPVRTVFIPKDWEGRHVRIYARGDPYSISGVNVNGSLVRRHHHNRGEYLDIDITRKLRFGEDNLIELYSAAYSQGTGVFNFNAAPRYRLDELRLELFD